MREGKIPHIILLNHIQSARLKVEGDLEVTF